MQYEQLPAPVESGTTASNIGTAYFFVRRMSEARRYYRTALTLEPGAPIHHMNLGDWYFRNQQADSARVQYREADRLLGELLQVNPKDSGSWLHRALCQAKLGNCVAATATLATIGQALPDSDANAAHEVARLEATCGNSEGALGALERALRYGIPPLAIAAEDEFLPLARNPRFVALLAAKR